MTVSLKQKQAEAKKFRAEQYVLLTPEGKKAASGVKEKRNLGGRPSSGRVSLPIWIGRDWAAVLAAWSQMLGVSEGIAVEMMLSVCADATLIQVVRSNK